MDRPPQLDIFSQLAVASFCGSLLGLLAGEPGWAQEKGYGQTLGTTPREREFYNNNIRPGDGGGDPAGVPNILGGLIDRLGGGSGKVDPTPPGSAIDQALKDLEVPGS